MIQLFLPIHTPASSLQKLCLYAFFFSNREFTCTSLKTFSRKRFLVGLTGYRGYQSIRSFTVVIDLVMVLDAILTSRQTREKLQCLYENLMSNNFRITAFLKKI